jgi:endonuclease YncB( thermonuclease family)
VKRGAPAALFGAALALGSCAGGGTSLEGWEIIGVIDGDTLRARVASLPSSIAEVHVRVKGIDTPEKGAQASCERERDLASRADAFTRAKIKGAQQVALRNFEWDKYGGRVLAEVLVDGQSLAGLLLANGLAQPYFGGTKPNWCFSPERGRRDGRGA